MRIFCFEIKYIGRKWFGKHSDRKIRQAVIKEWTETDNKISAMKMHRVLTGSGLKEAKEYCDELIDMKYITPVHLNQNYVNMG